VCTYVQKSVCIYVYVCARVRVCVSVLVYQKWQWDEVDVGELVSRWGVGKWVGLLCGLRCARKI